MRYLLGSGTFGRGSPVRKKNPLSFQIGFNRYRQLWYAWDQDDILLKFLLAKPYLRDSLDPGKNTIFNETRHTQKLKRNRIINGARRVFYATSYFNRKYPEILRWGFNSKEDTNYTYELKEGNLRYLAQIIAVVTGEPYSIVIGYIQEAQNDKELSDHVINAIKKSPYTAFADFRTGFARRLGWYAFVRILKPKVVVETGIDKGLGAVLLCAGLLRNRAEGFEGEYYGTDINPEAGYLLTGKYKLVGKILFGDSISSLQSFDKQIDLFIY